MKIGLVIYGDLGSLSGGYLYDRKLVEFLRSFCRNQVEIISIPRKKYLLNLSDNYIYRKEFFQSFDVLLQDELCYLSLFRLNQRLKNEISCPIIGIVHHLKSCEGSGFVNAWIERKYLESLDGFIFNSLTTKLEVENLLGRAKPLVVAYPSTDKTLKKRRPREKGPFKILFVGNLIPRKNLHKLINALAQLKDLDWSLRAIGDYDADRAYFIKLTKLVRKNRLEKKIFFGGVLSDDQLSEAYAQADILIVPSSYEGFGIVYLEALANQLPVVASINGGAREIIRHGREGFLINPDDNLELKETILRLISSREQLEVMSAYARDRAQHFLSWEASFLKVKVFLDSFKKIH
jgi:glycosyltransferase involved in cell wall biosynthesis